MGLFDFFTQKIGIDLGTSNTLVYVNNKGITLNEPSVVAINTTSYEVCAVGFDAKAMLERTPKTIRAIRPLQNGVIADFEITRAMIKYFITKALNKKRFIKSNIVISVPVGVTSIERRAVEEVAYDAGARKVKLVEEPMAAAIGAGLNVDQPIGNMIVDIGGGTTEIAVISLGGIVESDSLRIAGDDIDINIKEYIKNKYKMDIGIVTAENIKKVLGNASKEYYKRIIDSDERIDSKEANEDNEDFEINEDNKDKKDLKDKKDKKEKKDEKENKKTDYVQQMEIRGRDIVSGLPLKITITSDEVREAILETVNSIVNAIKRVLERTPPELSSDIYTNGIYLSGGGALLKGLDIYLEKETGIKVFIADNPLQSVALGAGKISEEL
ncbi:MAG TPA: rod shape-determining protein [Sedimentibacter sp.]|jgi:rod shape-determining protein MreB|nr:rod shape-determining protein [Tissierellia bacterium]HAS90962.1 rod shape-determining protein [Clostridiales bacterium]HOA19636.1 rod shape-determining protein [Sedimentibacter sp.]HOG62072.1 rod shape-determining protein [Sedimentibacter sp.]HOT21059.1 rod shape-determining protein [Sedimentibacter sp.]